MLLIWKYYALHWILNVYVNKSLKYQSPILNSSLLMLGTQLHAVLNLLRVLHIWIKVPLDVHFMILTSSDVNVSTDNTSSDVSHNAFVCSGMYFWEISWWTKWIENEGVVGKNFPNVWHVCNRHVFGVVDPFYDWIWNAVSNALYVGTGRVKELDTRWWFQNKHWSLMLVLAEWLYITWKINYQLHTIYYIINEHWRYFSFKRNEPYDTE